MNIKILNECLESYLKEADTHKDDVDKVINLPDDYFVALAENIDWIEDDTSGSGFSGIALFEDHYIGTDNICSDMDINNNFCAIKLESDVEWEDYDEPVGGHGDNIKWDTGAYLTTDVKSTKFTPGLYNIDNHKFTPCSSYKFHPIIDEDGDEDLEQIIECKITLSDKAKAAFVDRINDKLAEYEPEPDYPEPDDYDYDDSYLDYVYDPIGNY